MHQLVLNESLLRALLVLLDLLLLEKVVPLFKASQAERRLQSLFLSVYLNLAVDVVVNLRASTVFH